VSGRLAPIDASREKESARPEFGCDRSRDGWDGVPEVRRRGERERGL